MSGLVLVVFPRSRLCLLHENDNRLLLEMASTVFEGENCSTYTALFLNSLKFINTILSYRTG